MYDIQEWLIRRSIRRFHEGIADNEDLQWVLFNSTEDADKAWLQLEASQLTEDEIRNIIRNVPIRFCSKVLDYIKERQLNDDNLILLLVRTVENNEELTKEIITIMFERSTVKCLLAIIFSGLKTDKIEAWKRIQTLAPTKENMDAISNLTHYEDDEYCVPAKQLIAEMKSKAHFRMICKIFGEKIAKSRIFRVRVASSS